MSNIEHQFPGKLETHERFINVQPLQAQVVIYTLFDNVPKRRRVAYCLATVSSVEKKNGVVLPNGKKLVSIVSQILHIWTHPQHRRKGYARNLLEAVKEHVDVIYAEPLTPDAKKLWMNTGFIKAKDGDMFRWTR